MGTTPRDDEDRDRDVVDRRAVFGIAALGILGGGAAIAAAPTLAGTVRAAVDSAVAPGAGVTAGTTASGSGTASVLAAPMASPTPVASTIAAPPAGVTPPPLGAKRSAVSRLNASLRFAVAGDNAETRRHILARTTFGPRPSEVAEVESGGIDRWLARQLNPASIPDPSVDAVRAAFPLAALSIADVRAKVPEFYWDAQIQSGQAWLGHQVHSSRQLFEIVVDVLQDLLHVTIPNEKVWDSSPDWAYSLLRPRAFGTYSDLLKAAMKHPAMLSYLDNNESTRSNVNENLGRELLELHTVGVASGYTEADVRSSACILSGRRTDSAGNYRYSPNDHWIGPVSVLGFRHDNPSGAGGEAVGDAYLGYLASHPSTAQNVARRFAVRFVSDDPPATLLSTMVQAYLTSGTGILPMLRAMFRSREFWASAGQKTRRPLEDLVGTTRIMDTRPTADLKNGVTALYWYLGNLGQSPLAWQPPNGYPDVASAWLSASQMVGRWNGHRALASGWWAGIAPASPMDQAMKPAAGGTYGQWIDAIALRVLNRPLPAASRAAMVSFLGGRENGVVQSWELWKTGHVIALMLDSPLYQFR